MAPGPAAAGADIVVLAIVSVSVVAGSVRSAGAVLLDRLFGRPAEGPVPAPGDGAPGPADAAP